MKKFLIIMLLLAFGANVYPAPPSAPTKAKHSKTDTANFDGNLSGTDTTVQIALETIDDTGLGGDTTETNQDDAWAAVGGSGTETFITVTYQDATDDVDFVVPVLDEDNMATDSATNLATQQSIKAYVDAQTSALTPNSVKNSHIDWADLDNLGEEGALTVSDTTDTTSFVGLFESATGDLAAKTDPGLTYNATTGILTATGFTGPITGAVTGNSDSATLAATVTIADNESTNENNAVVFLPGGDLDGGNLALESDGTFYYNPSTGTVTATGFAGALTGNVTGNASGTAATVTGAAQAAITSVGTLTTLAIDNITINGNDISSTAGTDLTITPLAGQQIVLDGTIIIDAGVVTGATSITSTAFVGDITGDVTGNASGTAGLASTVTYADNESTNENNAVVFLPGGDLDGGNLAPEVDGTFNYNPSTGTVTATAFTGTKVTLTPADASPAADGEVLLDSTVTGLDDGALAYYEGGDTVYYVAAFPVLPVTDNHVLSYDSATDRLVWQADADSGGAPTLDNIVAPEGAWAITLQDTETVIWTTQTTATDQFNFDATGAFGDISIFVIEQLTGNPTNGTLLELKTADAEDNVDQLLITNGVDDYVTHHIVEAGTYTIDVTSDNVAAIVLNDTTSVTGVLTATGFTIGSAAITEAELEIIDGATLGTADINIIDGISDSGNLTAGELLYVDGVTSAIQTQLDVRALESVVGTSLDADDLELNGAVLRLVAEIPHIDATATISAVWTHSANIDLDDGTGASPSLIFTDATNETWTISKADAGDLDIVINNAADRLIDISNAGTGEANLTIDGDLTVQTLFVEGTSGVAGYQRIFEDPANQNHFRGWLAQSNFTQQFDHRFPDGEPSANNFYVMGAVSSEITDMVYAGLNTTYFDLGTITAITTTFLGVAPGTVYTGLTASQVMVDTDGTTDLAHDLLAYSDGTNDYIVVAFDATDMPSTGEDDYVVSYDATNNKFYFAAGGGGGSVAWDDITNPDANDEIDFGAYVIELNGEDLRIGDGGANYWKFDDGALTPNGTATISMPSGGIPTLRINTLLDVNEDIDVDLDAADEEINIAQAAVAGTADVALISINDDRTGATANVVAEATIWIDAEGVYAIAAVDGVVYGESLEAGGDVTVGDDVLLADGAVVGITGNEIITFNAAGTIVASGATFSAAGGTLSLTPVNDTAANFAGNFTGANLYGGTFLCSTTGTIQLPAIGTGGMNFTIITVGAIAVVVEPNASDLMVLDGTALDDADSATNTSTAGDIIVFQYMDATGWVATSNGWTDED